VQAIKYCELAMHTQSCYWYLTEASDIIQRPLAGSIIYTYIPTTHQSQLLPVINAINTHTSPSTHHNKYITTGTVFMNIYTIYIRRCMVFNRLRRFTVQF